MSHHQTQRTKTLLIILILFSLYFVVEIIGAWKSSSLSLLGDAGHMLTDILAIGLALIASHLALKNQGSAEKIELRGAWINGFLLVILALGLMIRSWHHWSHPIPVDGSLMSWVALGGLILNLVGLKLTHTHSHDNLNMRGVWLHIMADTLGSCSAVIAGLIITQTQAYWIDSCLSMILGALILWSALRLMTQASQKLKVSSPDSGQHTESSVDFYKKSG